MTRAPLTPAASLRWDALQVHLDALGPDPAFLEVGAGAGAIGSRLARRGRYVGVEPDDESRARAAARLPSEATVVASIDDVEGSFDVLCAFEVLEHIADDAGELARWVTHLVPGGTVLVSVPAHRHRFAAADEGVGHLRRYDPDDLAELLSGVGLTDVVVHLYGFPLGYPLEWARNLLARRDARRGAEVASAAQRSAGSGRLRQPPGWAGSAIEAATAPFGWLQRHHRLSRLGTGLIGVGRVARP